MSSEEARRRLSVSRRAETEFRDPFFSEALQMAAAEPALAQWWAEQRALDEVLAQRLRELSPPASFL